MRLLFLMDLNFKSSTSREVCPKRSVDQVLEHSQVKQHIAIFERLMFYIFN